MSVRREVKVFWEAFDRESQVLMFRAPA